MHRRFNTGLLSSKYGYLLVFMVLAAKIEREELVIAALPEQAVQILDQARQHGRVTIGGMIRVTGASRNTLKELFRSLVEKQHLVRLSTG
jgi:hypothetical protein